MNNSEIAIRAYSLCPRQMLGSSCSSVSSMHGMLLFFSHKRAIKVLPFGVFQIGSWMKPETPLERSPAVVMLDSPCVKRSNLAGVQCDDKL